MQAHKRASAPPGHGGGYGTPLREPSRGVRRRASLGAPQRAPKDGLCGPLADGQPTPVATGGTAPRRLFARPRGASPPRGSLGDDAPTAIGDGVARAPTGPWRTEREKAGAPHRGAPAQETGLGPPRRGAPTRRTSAPGATKRNYVVRRNETLPSRLGGRGRQPAPPLAPAGGRARRPAHGSYLVDSASSHMLVSKIKPCMSKYKH